MRKLNIALIGYGIVGQGVVQLLQKKKNLFKNKFKTEFNFKTLCDRSMKKKDPQGLGQTKLTDNIDDVLNDPELDVVIELIGGMNPARKIVETMLKKGKHVITANKELIANAGKDLFELATQNKAQLYFESSVGAGIPVIKHISEGLAGNKFEAIYAIINGTCNFILTQMSRNHITFEDALKEAQAKGYAESDPTLDINGMDSTHKLAILTYLAFGKFIPVKEIHTEGISQISQDDIEYAESLGLTIKLLAIAKKTNNMLEARVHPTLISQEHPLASVNSVYNAIYLQSDSMGQTMLSGQGAGQMAAASGVISDLINLAARSSQEKLLCNLHSEATDVHPRPIDEIKTRFYLRFMATDKPGVLASITGVLGAHGIGINSVSQKVHNPISSVPIIMLTDYTTEGVLRKSLEEIKHLPTVKGKPVTIRMEKL